MTRVVNCCLFLSVVALGACSDFDRDDVEKILADEKVYPLTLDHKMFCDNETSVKEVMESNLINDGFVTGQLKHTPEDLGKPLISFTSKAQPYLLPTNDTLKSFFIQRVKVAEEVFLQVSKIEINPAGNRAVVDYTTDVVNLTPFAVLYQQEVKGEKKRRTFFTRKENQWTWDGKIIKMPK